MMVCCAFIALPLMLTGMILASRDHVCPDGYNYKNNLCLNNGTMNGTIYLDPTRSNEFYTIYTPILYTGVAFFSCFILLTIFIKCLLIPKQIKVQKEENRVAMV
jgi:hypothetical protein